MFFSKSFIVYLCQWDLKSIRNGFLCVALKYVLSPVRESALTQHFRVENDPLLPELHKVSSFESRHLCLAPVSELGSPSHGLFHLSRPFQSRMGFSLLSFLFLMHIPVYGERGVSWNWERLEFNPRSIGDGLYILKKWKTISFKECC